MRAYSGAERREFPRIACTLQANYSPMSLIGSSYPSQIIDISLGGGRLKISNGFDNSFEKAAPLMLIIRMPPDFSAITIAAEVVWLKHIPNSAMNEVGVRFLQLDSTLNQFIKDRLRYKTGAFAAG